MKKRSKPKRSAKNIKFKKESDLPPTAISLADTMNNKTGKWRSTKPVIDHGRCTSCMICWKFCPDASIEIVEGKPRINHDYCKGCMICAEECPIKAINIEKEKK
ncbi:MAG: 4Fe-4S binding protein [Candidatus Omnitrophica bacterium]|nr:4Fe-4S binding protein [Candidatus Omnitrophota bacterium]